MERWHKSDWAILSGIILMAAFFRLWRLDAIPPGFQFDEAYNATDALRVLAGERPLFFEANGGREALHIYWIAPFVALLGPTAFALRLASASIGTLTVALSYLLWRRLLPERARGVAALASLLMAISYWHIHFSRYGIRAIFMPLILTLTFYFLWRASESQVQREWVMARAAKNWRAHPAPSWLPAVLCGFFLGLSAYAHPAARFLPVIVVLWVAWRLWEQRKPAPSPFAHFAPLEGQPSWLPLLIAATAFVVFLPLGLYFFQNPQSFFGHPTVVAITDQRVSEGDVLSAFVANLWRVAGMFFIRGDEAWIHNLAGRPVFDGVSASFFVVGLGVWAQKLWRRERIGVFLAIWTAIMLLPTLLSDAAPNFSRAIGIMPALFVIPAWGIHYVYDALSRITHHALRFSFALLLLLSAAFTFRDYFAIFPAQPETYTAYDVDKIDAAQHLMNLARTDRIYLPPLWARHATFALLTREAGFKSFDNGEVMVLPARDPQRGMVYAFPAIADPAYMQEFERAYGVLARKAVVNDARGQPLLIEYRIAAQDIPASATALLQTLPIAPQKMVAANFDNQIEFVGYRLLAPQSSEQPYQLTLVWQAQQPMAYDYTLFIHLNDASGNRVAQRDRRPGNGSYPTTAWSAGDLVIETYEMSPRTAGGPLQFAVGWYRRDNGQRLPVLDANGHVMDDKVTFAAEGTQ